jgi:hypothetical protein
MKKSRELKIVFVDDNDTFLDDCRARFKRGCPGKGVQIEENDRDTTQRAVLSLDQARRKTREGKELAVADGADLFNDADIVIVDYDLMELEATTALTGEDIAYLVRCFSTCGFVVLLNPYDLGTKFFDLRLRRPYESWADLVLGSEQLDNSWLWDNKPSHFSPWSWPNLVDAVARRELQRKDCLKALETPVLDLVGIPSDAQIAMDHVMGEPITDPSRVGKTKSRKSYTLKDFVLKSGYCIHRRDNEKKQFAKSDEQISRIGAARLSSWLEHVVLPAQSVVVDAPHLVTRLPALLAGNPAKLASWNATCRRDEEADTKSLRTDQIKKSRFMKAHWLSRSAWFWPHLSASDNYSDWAQAEEMANVVFCEDTSSFVDRTSASEFVADVPAQFAHRYVEMPTSNAKIASVDYRPSVRLSM